MILRAALACAGRGVPVFPCEPAAKRPLTRNGHWDATTDPRDQAFFRYPREKEIRNSVGLLGPGLDVRGEGGYVVVPPSRTQGACVWVDRSPLAEASWLIERLGEEDEATLF